ncbi:MAG: LysR family transcriptional regulator [Coxiellaceae bacterium]|nr:LysR family transcriptional regulator [Coxiellaceae bacterium]
MNIDQRDLFNFYHTVCQQSFTKAAEHLGVSKGYISKSIYRLEAQLKQKLMQRTTRQFTLTPAGEELFATANSMQATLQSGLESLQVLNQSPHGLIKVSASPAVANRFLAPLFARFMVAFPNITIDVDIDTTFVDIIGKQYDMVFRGARLEDSNLVAKKLFDIGNILVASPALFEHYPKPSTPEDLAQLPCMAYPIDGRVIWRFQHQRKKSVINIKPKLVCNHSAFLRQCALSGGGVASIQSLLIHDEIKQGKLIHLLPEWQLRSTPLYMLYPSREFLPLKTRCLIDFIVEHSDCGA